VGLPVCQPNDLPAPVEPAATTPGARRCGWAAFVAVEPTPSHNPSTPGLHSRLAGGGPS
jgi:hypothetical protein